MTNKTNNIHLMLTFLHFILSRRKIKFFEDTIKKENRKNDLLDQQIADFKTQIDNKNFEKDFLIQEKDIMRRKERYLINCLQNNSFDMQ